MSGKPTPTFSSNGRKQRVLDVGGKNGVTVRQYYPDADITVVDMCNGWDVMKLGLPTFTWDVIFASHFIEHIVNPDFFLDECKRVMQPESVLEIATPNLAAWFNRGLLLFGYQPHFTEVSTRYDVGKFRMGKEEAPGGHLRLFTARALRELLVRHGFTIRRFVGRPIGFSLPQPLKALDQCFSQWPSTASELRVTCGYGG